MRSSSPHRTHILTDLIFNLRHFDKSVKHRRHCHLGGTITRARLWEAPPHHGNRPRECPQPECVFPSHRDRRMRLSVECAFPHLGKRGVVSRKDALCVRSLTEKRILTVSRGTDYAF